MSEFEMIAILICLFDIGYIADFEFVPDILCGGAEKFYSCREAQARRVVEKSIIDPPLRQRAGMFFAYIVADFSRKRHPRHGPSALLSDLAPADFWLFPKIQECAKREAFPGC
jgi:hypothetical protein